MRSKFLIQLYFLQANLAVRQVIVTNSGVPPIYKSSGPSSVFLESTSTEIVRIRAPSLFFSHR